MNGTLALPRLSAAIPLALRAQCSEGKLAEYIIAAGCVSEIDVPRELSTAVSPLDVCERALQRWLRGTLGPLRLLCPAIMLRHDAPDDEVLELEWSELGQEVLLIGPVLERLEGAVAGLGASVLSELLLQDVWPLWGQSDAVEHLINDSWYGEESEHIMLDEHSDTPQERAELLAAIVTRAAIDAAVPLWARDSQRHVALDDAQLARLASELDEAGCAARLLLDLRHALARMRRAQEQGCMATVHFPGMPRPDSEDDEDWQEFVGYAKVFGWRGPTDTTVRVFDEMYNYAMQGECCYAIGRVLLHRDHPEQLRRWCAAMEMRLRVVAAVDALLAVVAQPY